MSQIEFADITNHYAKHGYCNFPLEEPSRKAKKIRFSTPLPKFLTLKKTFNKSYYPSSRVFVLPMMSTIC